jgi:hypothetical protein
LDKETQTLDRFLHAEQPSFYRWLAGIAGELLTEIREAGLELERLEGLVGEVQERVWLDGITPQKAYRKVRAAEARRAAGEPADLEQTGGDDFAYRDDFEAQLKEEFARFVHENVAPDQRRAFQEEVKRFGREAFGEDLSWMVGEGTSSGEAAGSQAQLKTLYRQLVGILHPDRRDPQLDQAICTELWHELQRAYHDRDLERLRTVYARVEYSLGIDTPQQTTVWELRAEAENLRGAVRAVKNQVKLARLHPGWQFSTRGDLDDYAAQLKRHLEQELNACKDEIAGLQAVLKTWETGRRSKAQRRKKETWPLTQELF